MYIYGLRQRVLPRPEVGEAHRTLVSAGLERDKFDNKTVSFEEHIKAEHNMWHYLYFLVLVRVKDPTEYTGPESYVAYMIKVSGPGAWGRGPGGPSGYARTHARTHTEVYIMLVAPLWMAGSPWCLCVRPQGGSICLRYLCTLHSNSYEYHILIPMILHYQNNVILHLHRRWGQPARLR